MAFLRTKKTIYSTKMLAISLLTNDSLFLIISSFTRLYMYTQPDGYILQMLARGFHVTAQIVVGIIVLERLVVLNWAYLFHRYNTERRTRIICIWLSSLCIPTNLSLLCSTKTYKLWSGITGLLLAHRIRISEILPWVRKSYLTQTILPRQSREGYIHWLYWNSRTWSSSEVIVMFK